MTDFTQLTVAALYDLTHTAAAPLLGGVTYPWQALAGLGAFIAALGERLPADEYERVAESTWVHRTARVAASAHLGAGIIIGAGAEVRHGAYIRERALVGQRAVVGNSTELKNAILFDGAQVPHYNYVGDAVLGYGAHMGAGAVTSNVKSDKTPVTVRVGDTTLATGCKKCGAMLGDGVEVGCHAVLNPGTVVGRGSRVYPLSSVRGYVPAGSIYKQNGVIVPIAAASARR